MKSAERLLLDVWTFALIGVAIGYVLGAQQAHTIAKPISSVIKVDLSTVPKSYTVQGKQYPCK